MIESDKPKETPTVNGCLAGLLRLAGLKLLGLLLLKSSVILAVVVVGGGTLLLGFEPPDWFGCLVVPAAMAIFFGLLFGVFKLKDRLWPGSKMK